MPLKFQKGFSVLLIIIAITVCFIIVGIVVYLLFLKPKPDLSGLPSLPLATQKQVPVKGCGNNLCEEGENFNSCPSDCYNPDSSGPELVKLTLSPSDFPPPPQGTSWVRFFDQLVEESYVWPSLQNQGALAIYETITRLSAPGDISWDQWGRLEQYILVFPQDKISKVFESTSIENLSKLTEQLKFSVQELPDPAVGEKSRAFKVDAHGGNYSVYAIFFIKKGFLEHLIFSGDKYEYNVFPPLARKAADKIQ